MEPCVSLLLPSWTTLAQGQSTGQCTDERVIAHLDTVQDRWVEHVDTGVDPVSDEFDWLLDESVDNCGIGLGDDDTVSGRFGDLCDLWVCVSICGLRCYICKGAKGERGAEEVGRRVTDHDRSLASVLSVEIA